MKVILAAKSVYPFHPIGGVQKCVYYFARHLKQQGVDVEIVAPLDRGGKPRTEVYEGITYHLIPPAISSYLELPVGWLGVHLFSHQLAHFLKDRSFDVLHSFDMAGLYYLNVKDHKPVIAHIFTDNYLSNPIPFWNYLSLFGINPRIIQQPKIVLSPFIDLKTKMLYPVQYLFKVRPMHRYLQGAKSIFLEDESLRPQLKEIHHIPAEKIHVVPVGVDMAYVRQRVKGSALGRKDLDLCENDLVLLTVNRLAADKGIDKIILALNIIRRRIPRVRLVIVGKGYQEPELRSLIVANGLGEHVRLIKDVQEEDLYGYYGISDLYVCAFSFPGSSISSLEAMAAGLPIITTAQPWLVVGGNNGISIPDNQPSTIADAVLKLAGEDLKAKGAVSLEIAAGYDWSRIASSAIAHYCC